MAYDANDYAVQVEGTLATSEGWSNTWAFHSIDGTGTLPDLATALHTFYADIAATHWTTLATALNAEYRHLDGSGNGTLTWAAITGGVATDLIPTECAVRLSLRADNNSRGGPFLPGFGVNALAADGGLDSAALTVLEDAVIALIADLASADWILGLNNVTTSDLRNVQDVRIGRIFDVIRRRRNDLPEEYVVVPTS